MQKYRWIIFDADGTLFDYDRAELSALTRTFGQYELSFDGGVHRRYERINARLWMAFERGEVSSKRLRVQRFEELLHDLEIDRCPSQFSSGQTNDSSIVPTYEISDLRQIFEIVKDEYR